MRRILITGAAGFIGAHILEYFLRNTDAELILMDRLDMSGTLHRVKQVMKDWEKDAYITRGVPYAEEQMARVKFVWHDLKSPINDFVNRKIGQVDDIIHLAASSHVDRSIEDPLSFIMDNVVGTTNLLNWGRLGGMISNEQTNYTGKFINFSTDEVFGPAAEGHAHGEDEPHRPSNPYSASKSGQEAIGYAFFITYGLPVVTTHTMNNFGQMQHPEKLVPSTIRNVINGKEQPIFAELNDKNELEGVGSRYWIHGKNTADAVKFLLEKGKAGESYNIIGFDELTNLEIAEKVASLIGKPLIPKFVDFHKVRPGHDRRYALDGSKMRDMGWTPVVDFETGLKETIEWTLAHPEWQ